MLSPDLLKLTQSTKEVSQWGRMLCFVSYGLSIGIHISDRAILEALPNYLPPNWQPFSSARLDKLYSIMAVSDSPDYLLSDETGELAKSQDLEDIFEVFDSELRLWLGVSVQNRLFVHAGVVEWKGKAIVIPGRSFSGKTTLVAALVQAGATYYSDEYALIDTDGLVHPYPRALSIRQGEGQRTKRCPVEVLGGLAGEKPIPIGLIVQTQYQSEAQWSPQEISGGQAVLTLLDNTLVARLRPEFALPILGKAVSGAVILKSQRGEAEETARVLLQHFDNLINFNREENHHDTSC
ncbi:hypothetical protein [Aphanothece sacrum]|uniref:HPr kinase n=1 Tax=Aphanothece sacrum FPU1 TaxID=1920663 RepID=A0A401IMV3_APHSA|nr:hypothetical protein [Aphanothece sacrum]GBF82594.1 HPr kinase [Aphanothece sacrum FPU1]GBF84728.1 HPr kinase [Aphanothece sacrum FPU3]